jgi:hypothetical protein
MFEHLDFTRFWLQPMDGPERAENTRLAVEYCMAHPRWELSLRDRRGGRGRPLAEGTSPDHALEAEARRISRPYSCPVTIRRIRSTMRLASSSVIS